MCIVLSMQLFLCCMFVLPQGTDGSVVVEVTDTRVSNQRLNVTIQGFCDNTLTVTRLFRIGVLMMNEI